MNQILSVDNGNKDKGKKTKRSRQPIQIDKIVKFFSIVVIIYGVFMIGTGSYSMYKNAQDLLSIVKPTIFVEETSEEQITLKITHNKNLAKVSYNWNSEEEIEIPCDGKKSIEQVVDIPTGTNVLNVYASDINGQEIKYPQTFTRIGNINIDIEAEGNNIKITAEGKDELSYMTYRWDDEEETKIDINNTRTEQKIEVKKGNHTLTVIVVDVNNKTETKTKEIQGVTKPTLEVTTDGVENLVIKTSDEQGLQKIEFIIYGEDDTERKRLILDGRTELEYKYPLHEGENKIEVTVYNLSDVTETKRVKVTK